MYREHQKLPVKMPYYSFDLTQKKRGVAMNVTAKYRLGYDFVNTFLKKSLAWLHTLKAQLLRLFKPASRAITFALLPAMLLLFAGCTESLQSLPDTNEKNAENGGSQSADKQGSQKPSTDLDTKTEKQSNAAPSPTAKPERPEMSPTPSPEMKNTRLPFVRGINIGNCLEAPTEGAWGLVIQDEWMSEIKRAGFDHIRLPVRWSAHAEENSPYTIDPQFLARVNHVIDIALEAGLGIVVNVHHYQEMATEPLEHTERLKAIWRQLAANMKDRPDSVAFELMNEPNGAANAVWGSIWPELFDIVRDSDANRFICITAADWSSAGSLSGLMLPEHIKNDAYTFATFHFYEPHSFTHQSASWVPGSAAWAGTTWNGNAAQQRAITNSLDRVVWWQEKNGNMPVYLGEFGAYSAADMESRLRWTEFVAREAERRGFAWAYWEFASGFGIYDDSTDKYDLTFLKTLLPDTAILSN